MRSSTIALIRRRLDICLPVARAVLRGGVRRTQQKVVDDCMKPCRRSLAGLQGYQSTQSSPPHSGISHPRRARTSLSQLIQGGIEVTPQLCRSRPAARHPSLMYNTAGAVSWQSGNRSMIAILCFAPWASGREIAGIKCARMTCTGTPSRPLGCRNTPEACRHFLAPSGSDWWLARLAWFAPAQSKDTESRDLC